MFMIFRGKTSLSPSDAASVSHRSRPGLIKKIPAWGLLFLFGLLLGKQVSTGAAKGGAASTTLSSRLEKGLKYLHVADTTGFTVSDAAEFGAASSTELRTVAAVRTAAATGSTTLGADAAAGTTALTVADNTGFAQHDYLTIGAGATLEVHKVASVASTDTINLTDGLINAQANGSNVVEVTNVLEVNLPTARAHAAAAAVVERQAPYTHALTPCDLADLPWATIERSVAGLLVNRFEDVRIQRIAISGEAGQPITLNVSYLAIDEERQVSAQSATYEANDPFIFWMGTYTVDGSDISSKVNQFNLELINVFHEADQTHEHIRAHIPLIRRDVELSWTMKFDAIARYAETYLGAAAGTESQETIAMSSGALSIDLSYGADTAERGLKVEIPGVYHTVAAVELDSGSTESQEYACEGHARKIAGSELVEVTIKNAEAGKYA